ncbi:hypothetical protein FEE96_22590 [Parasedimentitalea maritima]|uniref:DNA-binding protein n=1 Tax=Parasedimentitalea maritima TaxID=2578117 RepID=A0ABY2UR33_9RHOB|nr:hypothetical protein [Zongyanglinia marina]TLP55508.1 hypothetical protein FEE96_22590 [Zongyanglinia marina]
MYAHYVSGVLRRMKRSRLTVEQRQELARRHAVGEDVNTLSKAYQVTIRQVYRVLADEKGDTRGRARVSKSVSFRAPTGEIDAFLASARGVGITGSSQAFRALVRMALGLFELFPNQLEDFNRSVWLIGKEGQLLNQLAKSVHKGKLRLTDEDRILLSKCIDVNKRLYDELRDILDEAKTRRGYALSQLSRAKGQGDG